MPTSSSLSPNLLTNLMQSDRFALQRSWQKLSKTPALEGCISQLVKCEEHEQLTALSNQLDIPEQHRKDVMRWIKRASESWALYNRRQDSVPELHFDPELPISEHRQEIAGLLSKRQVIVVCGETGSGKSTQLPKICLEAGFGRRGMIGHTQPRRLAARAVASRLAQELHSQVGNLVGHKIRFSDVTRAETLIKVMTDGILLAETQSDRFLDQYDALIIDEAHERSLNIDFLLGFLRQISGKRPDLKLIITSATIDPEKFAKHFADEQGPAPIIEVSGRTYPVEVRYQDPESAGYDIVDDEEISLKAIADATDELLIEGDGDILVFLPTERDIRLAAKHLRGHFTDSGDAQSIEILPLYARLSQAEQNRIFQPHNKRRIVLATNVAESSLTVPGIHFVIDTGLARISRYAPRSKVRRLPVEAVSQASANQRSGRCGRLGPGVCIRLYSQEDYSKRSAFTTPEIRRSDLASVLLQSLSLRLGPLEEFPLLDPPSAEAMRDARRTLQELGAIDSQGKLTKIGRQLGKLPCEPRIGRMLLEGHERQCLTEVLIIASGLEVQDVRQRPAGYRTQADAAHAMFQDPLSDYLSLVRLWDFYEKLRKDLGRSRLQKALTSRFLSTQGFREWSETIRQFRELLSAAGMKPGKRQLKLQPVPKESEDDAADHPRGSDRTKKPPKRPNHYDPVHQALLTGLLSGVATKGERHEYQAAGNIAVSLWPGSGLFRRKPKWIMANEVVETSRRYARTIAEIDVAWIESAAKDLLKHSYYDPHWSSKNGSAMVYRKSTLYGLTVVSGRRMPYANIDRDSARQMMIEHGLAGGEWRCDSAFFKHNQELIADMHELVQRTRSRDYIVDRYHLASFYTDAVPPDVFDLASLKRWLQQHQNSDAEKKLWMKPEDLLREPHGGELEIHEAYPNVISIGTTELPLDYHFEPGSNRDGVTITVPQIALRQVSEDALGWLVPGLIEEKILALIKSLPKAQRTCFVPAPDVAKKLAQQLLLQSRERPFMSVLCEAMAKHSGERITSGMFDQQRIPAHLQFHVEVIDDDGQVVGESRDVNELIKQFAPVSESHANLVADAVTDDSWQPRDVTADSFETLPAEITVRRGGVLVAAFPALFDSGESNKPVTLRLATTKFEANKWTERGLTRLVADKHNRVLNTQVKHLPQVQNCTVQLSHLVTSDRLKRDLKQLITRIGVFENKPPVRTAEDFQACLDRSKHQISIATQDVALWLPKLADNAHQLRLAVEKSPTQWSEVVESIQLQLEEMFFDDFLLEVPWYWLSEFPRYLEAAKLRLQKLTSGGLPKDRKTNEPIVRAWDAYLAAKDADTQPSDTKVEKLDYLRWLIEEFRVSQFAQQLRTKETASQKRINKLIDEITEL